MCIIVYKAKGIKMPSYKTIDNCFDNNPDGAGFSYSDGITVHARKGYMNIVDFYTDLTAIPDIENKDVAMHFRIATHGGVTRGLTHPFPFTNNPKNMTRLEFTSDLAVMHNGIFQVKTKHGLSDTCMFIMKVLHPCGRKRILDDEDLQARLSKEIIGSRILIMGVENTVLLGKWTDIDTDGVVYSNTTYKYSYYRYTIPTKVTVKSDWSSEYDCDDSYFKTGREFSFRQVVDTCAACGEPMAIHDVVTYINGDGYCIECSREPESKGYVRRYIPRIDDFIMIKQAHSKWSLALVEDMYTSEIEALMPGNKSLYSFEGLMLTVDAKDLLALDKPAIAEKYRNQIYNVRVGFEFEITNRYIPRLDDTIVIKKKDAYIPLKDIERRYYKEITEQAELMGELSCIDIDDKEDTLWTCDMCGHSYYIEYVRQELINGALLCPTCVYDCTHKVIEDTPTNAIVALNNSTQLN
jgi:hypothetical protein